MRGGAARRAAAVLAAAAATGCVAPGADITRAAPPRTAAMPPAPLRPAPTIRLSGELVQGGLIGGEVGEGPASLTLDGRPVAVASDGRFILGLDRDASARAVLVATTADGRRAERVLAIAPRAWNVSRLPTLPKVPVPQPEFERRRPPELARIAAARAMATDAAGWRQRFAWPVTGRISTLFGSQRIYANGEAGSYHSGIDVARATGTVVTAPADGVVILAADAPFTLEGNLLMLDHGMGLSSAFLHLSRIDVGVGAHVRQGQPVGLVGATGRATGAHLHWGLSWQGARLDPLLAAGPMPPG